MISSVAYLLELIVRTFILGAMYSDSVILTLEQQMDVLEELVRDNRVEVNFRPTLATNGMDNAASNEVKLHQAGCQCDHRGIMHDFFKHQLNADSRVRTHIYTSLSAYKHYVITLLVYKVRLKYSGYNCNRNILLSFKEALYRSWCGVNRLGDSGVKVV